MSVLQETFSPKRNQTTRRGITTPATPPRVSDPGPSTSTIGYTPSPERETAPGPLPGAVPRGPSGHDPRSCRRCKNAKPAYTFLLLSAPQAKSWATRYWCGDCLVTGGHVRAKHLADAHALEQTPAPFEPVILTREQHDRVAHRIAVHAHVVVLLDLALDDRAFSDAIQRASEQLVTQRRAHVVVV